MANEIDDILKHLSGHPGVEGYVLINSEGVPIKTTLENALSVQYAGLISSLSEKSRTVVKDLDAGNDLVFIRLRTHKYEIMVAPDKEFILTFIQNPVN